MSEAACTVTAADKFYDALATSLGLPKIASVSGWDRFGRVIAPSAYARGVVDGIVMFGIEATYIVRDCDPELIALQTRPQHVEASCEEEKPAPGLATLIRKQALLRSSKVVDKGHMEVKRSPLPYFTEQQERAKFDPWQDFIVHHREEVSVNAKPFAGLTLDGCEQFRAPRSI